MKNTLQAINELDLQELFIKKRCNKELFADYDITTTARLRVKKRMLDNQYLSQCINHLDIFYNWYKNKNIDYPMYRALNLIRSFKLNDNDYAKSSITALTNVMRRNGLWDNFKTYYIKTP